MEQISENQRAQLIELMKSCIQTSGMTILEHGEMVSDYASDLLNHLRTGCQLKYQWQLPEWIYSKALITNLPIDQVIHDYHLFHDVGKPLCLTIDEDGRRHFPCHADVSTQLWLDSGGSQEVADLISMDMDIHLLKADGIEEFSSRKQANILLLTGLAEIHANASMFGGITSTSFKIKYKQIEKRGKVIVKHLEDAQNLSLLGCYYESNV